jgi:photosystem II stability/assembly factor-like uncharacterized protein
VLSSDDGGDTFHTSNAGFSARQITAFKRDDNHPGTILVGVVNDKEWGGVFRSTDGGLTWVQRSDGLQGRDVFALGQAPDGTFIAGTAHGIFRLDAATDTWSKVDDAPGATRVTDGLRPPAVALSGPSPLRRNPVVLRRAMLVVKSKQPAPASRKSVPAPHHKAQVRTRLQARQKPGTKPALRRAVAPVKSAPMPARPAAEALVAQPLASATPSGEAPPAADAAAALPTETAPPASKGFDEAVYAIETSGQRMLAITSVGLLTSDDDGLTWTLTGPERSADWRYLAAARNDVVAASLHSLSFSADSGRTWAPMLLPEGLTQVGAAAVDPSGAIWVGGREGIFVSHDGGNTWNTPKNLYVNTVNNIFFDEASSRMLVTTGGYSNIIFLVQLPDLKVSFLDTGWNLRFARPVGDHFIAATLYDGVVIEPRMVPASIASTPATRTAAEVAPVRAMNAAPSER